MVVIALVLGSYVNRFKQVSITTSVESQISIYGGSADNEAGYDKNKPIATIRGKLLLKKVKPGTYNYIIEPVDPAYETRVAPFDMKNTPRNISISIDYTKTRLSEIASAQRPAIEQLLSSKYGTLFDGYSVGDIQAFDDGSWIGVRINPALPTGDTYICIFKQVDKILKQVTDPPALTIASPIYPQIPRDVVVDTNLMLKDLY